MYGIPCDVEAIDAIAKKHGLKVIYDAAHAFDVKYKGRSILQWGDASTLSFHATKLFHTVEGGAVVLHNEEADRQLRLLRSFGHNGDEHFCLGMNAKMSEVHAAMGMAVLPHMEGILTARKRITDRYNEAMADLPVQRPLVSDRNAYNHAYYPILLRSAEERESVLKNMAQHGVMCRRYFFPSLNCLPYVSPGSMPVSEWAAASAICLPFHDQLTEAQIDRVVMALKNSLATAPALVAEVI